MKNDRLELGKRVAAAIYWENDPIGQGAASMSRLLDTRYRFGKDRARVGWSYEQQDYEKVQMLRANFYGGHWDDQDNPFFEIGREYAREVIP